MNIRRWFSSQKQSKNGNGLFATLEELIEMRRYTPYMYGFRQSKSFSCQIGDFRSAFKGRGIEFEEIRSYNFGDDVRDIDWRVTARKEKPYTKIYMEEKDRERTEKSFFVPKDEIVGNDYDLSINKYKK